MTLWRQNKRLDFPGFLFKCQEKFQSQSLIVSESVLWYFPLKSSGTLYNAELATAGPMYYLHLQLIWHIQPMWCCVLATHSQKQKQNTGISKSKQNPHPTITPHLEYILKQTCGLSAVVNTARAGIQTNYGNNIIAGSKDSCIRQKKHTRCFNHTSQIWL